MPDSHNDCAISVTRASTPDAESSRKPSTLGSSNPTDKTQPSGTDGESGTGAFGLPSQINLEDGDPTKGCKVEELKAVIDRGAEARDPEHKEITDDEAVKLVKKHDPWLFSLSSEEAIGVYTLVPGTAILRLIFYVLKGNRKETAGKEEGLKAGDQAQHQTE